MAVNKMDKRSISRRPEFLYQGAKTREISFPLGGLGTGCIGLSGDGRLVDWEIFNKPNKGVINGYSHFAIKAENSGIVLDTRLLHGDLLPPYSGEGQQFGSGPNRGYLAGLPHFRTSTFRGEFPKATISLEDQAFPGSIELTAFNPFIPQEDKDSGIPGAFFEIEVRNTTETPIAYTICFSAKNPLPGKPKNHFRYDPQLSTIQMSSCDLQPDDPRYGDITISTDAEDVSHLEHWDMTAYKGGWADDVNGYWKKLAAPGRFNQAPVKKCARNTGASKSHHASLAAHIEVKPRETRTIRFLITWNFPLCTNYWNPVLMDDGIEDRVANTWKNYYATLWGDSTESARYAFERWDALHSTTNTFRNVLFSSTLPPVVIDAVSANLSVLKSPTVQRLEDGTLYGWEGCHPDEGCCEGSCTHVWNYAYALPFLFPKLERGMREVDYRHNMGPDGSMSFRLQLPLGRPRWEFRPCVDGQFGGVIQTYRDWKISGDTDWLLRLWPSVEKSLSFAWSPDNADQWDRNRDGVLEGLQHHTLDVELFGPSSWLNGFYLAALKAASEMANHLNKDVAANEYNALFESGKLWVDEHLFNGEYYHQDIDLTNKDILEEFMGPRSSTKLDGRSEADIFWDEYWDEEHQQIRYQVAEGCGIDQVVAQWHANLCGLGEVFDKTQTLVALRSIYNHNFVRELRKVNNRNRRVFSINDEAGVLTCSYPRHEPEVPLSFAAETMSGFEYQVACHMVQEGMMSEGLEIVSAIRKRHDGEKRNPWNEFECGSNYARSMASYALLPALSGFKFDMTKGVIGFDPKQDLQSHQYFWSINEGWGIVEINDNNINLSVLHGSLVLREYHSKLIAERGVQGATLDDRGITFTVCSNAVLFDKMIDIQAGKKLRMEFDK